MGGRVLFALSIAAFPEDFPKEALAAVFEAAAAKVREAGGVLAGGHTIRDPEPKYGLAVIGAAHPDRLFRKGGARPGDVLLLTKRLGTGFLVSGRRQGRTSDADLDAAIDQMRTLNRAASEVLVRPGSAARPTSPASGCSATASRWRGPRGRGSCSTRTRSPRSTGRWTSRAAGVETGGAGHNRRFTAPSLTVGAASRPELVALAHDPQTSGGLLAAVPADVERRRIRPCGGGDSRLARRRGARRRRDRHPGVSPAPVSRAAGAPDAVGSARSMTVNAIKAASMSPRAAGISPSWLNTTNDPPAIAITRTTTARAARSPTRRQHPDAIRTTLLGSASRRGKLHLAARLVRGTKHRRERASRSPRAEPAADALERARARTRSSPASRDLDPVERADQVQNSR